MIDTNEYLKDKIVKWNEAFESSLTIPWEDVFPDCVNSKGLRFVEEVLSKKDHNDPHYLITSILFDKIEESFEVSFFKVKSRLLGIKIENLSFITLFPKINKPNYISMYLTYIASNVYKRKLNSNLRFSDIDEILRQKIVKKSDLTKLWEFQKLSSIEQKYFPGEENLIDIINKDILQEIYK